jgi:ribonuclease BN (tRNA processing enzyme)
MKIKCWGSRGSLPTPGTNTVKFGGNTTCFQLDGDDGTLIILDAGSGIRALGHELMRNDPRKKIVLLITHAHWDHLCGFPFFVPAYSKKYIIKIMGCCGVSYSLKEIVSHQFKAPYFPVLFRELDGVIDFIQNSNGHFHVGEVRVECIKLNHPGGGVGYRFSEKGATLVFLTDNEISYRHKEGLPREAYVEFARNADLLIHDAQYTTQEYSRLNKGWGHSTFDDAFNLASAAGVKKLGFCHHDQERRDIDLERMEKHFCRKSKRMRCFMVREGTAYSV